MNAKDILERIKTKPTLGNSVHVDLPFDYWVKLDIYLHGKEFMFCLKTKHNADEIRYYKYWNTGIRNISKLLNRF